MGTARNQEYIGTIVETAKERETNQVDHQGTICEESSLLAELEKSHDVNSNPTAH
jgi:hypothetical protein